MTDQHTTASAIGLPPDDAIAFLRQKTNITSEHWTDLWHEAHARAFTVAGAASQALVEDFRREVARALEQGTSLADFRKSFDAIVQKHGWEHNGSPGWRAQIIYETNLSTAYSAGRYKQMTQPDTLAVYPYWQYVHNAAAHPRLQHVAWDGLTLPADDPWWSTHYPPNGWRCHCSVRPVSRRDLARMGKDAPDSAPDLDLRPWKNPKTGEVVQVPHGIDPGFGTNPGKAWLDRGPSGGPGAPAPARQGPKPPAPTPAPAPGAHPASPAAPAVPAPSQPPRRMPPAEALPATDYREWAQEQIDAGKQNGTGRVVGVLPKQVIEKLDRVGAAPSSREITLTSDALRHLTRDAKRNSGKSLDVQDVLRLPESLASPMAVLRDRRHGELLFVFPPHEARDARMGKVVVRLRQNVKLRSPFGRETREINSIVTAGLVSLSSLRNPGNYDVMLGGLDEAEDEDD